ncbi:hypothetical protein L596_026279 [Steinernema carpocapsae]|uniref:Endonuclease/exonuclease/phosphatase domain-containing protein n=1 Tax=Steinernema carpocapsae TaxID=34508 RepID=A0A4U5M0X6_STECR|nr:hypothetical protein L596_026279 [Steinernema carpocapsae]
MSEWLRRLTRNQLGSARVGSNPARAPTYRRIRPATGSSRSRGRARTEDAGTAEENDEKPSKNSWKRSAKNYRPTLDVYDTPGRLQRGIGSRSEEAEEETAVGPHGHGERNRRDNCSSNSAKNSASVSCFLVKARQGRKWTHAAPNGLKSCIDYILAPRTVCFKKATVMSSHNAGSDHRLLRATIQDQARPRRKTSIPRPNAKKANRQGPVPNAPSR